MIVPVLLAALCVSACDHSSQTKSTTPPQPAPKPEDKPAPPTPPPAPTAPTASAAPPTPKPHAVLKRTELPDGLMIEDLRFGDGAEVQPHDVVKVHYRGTLADGREFESSYKGDPHVYPLDRAM